MKKGRKVFKIVTCIVALGVILFCALGAYTLFGSATKSTSDISYYLAMTGEGEGHAALSFLGGRAEISCPYDMPTQADLDACQSCRFDYTAKRVSIFESHAYILVCKYPEEAYIAQKEVVNRKYKPFTGEIPGEGNNALENEFELDGFSFTAAEGGNYPKRMLFVGGSDGTNEIAYIYFYDTDLDYISGSMPEFILEDTGWGRM